MATDLFTLLQGGSQQGVRDASRAALNQRLGQVQGGISSAVSSGGVNPLAAARQINEANSGERAANASALQTALQQARANDMQGVTNVVMQGVNAAVGAGGMVLGGPAGAQAAQGVAGTLGDIGSSALQRAVAPAPEPQPQAQLPPPTVPDNPFEEQAFQGFAAGMPGGQMVAPGVQGGLQPRPSAQTGSSPTQAPGTLQERDGSARVAQVALGGSGVQSAPAAPARSALSQAVAHAPPAPAAPAPPAVPAQVGPQGAALTAPGPRLAGPAPGEAPPLSRQAEQYNLVQATRDIRAVPADMQPPQNPIQSVHVSPPVYEPPQQSVITDHPSYYAENPAPAPVQVPTPLASQGPRLAAAVAPPPEDPAVLAARAEYNDRQARAAGVERNRVAAEEASIALQYLTPEDGLQSRQPPDRSSTLALASGLGLPTNMSGLRAHYQAQLGRNLSDEEIHRLLSFTQGTRTPTLENPEEGLR